MNISILIYRSSNISLLIPIIVEMETRGIDFNIYIKQEKGSYIYKILRKLKILKKAKRFEYETNKIVAKKFLNKTKIIYFYEEKELIRKIRSNKSKKIISIEPCKSYFTKNYDDFIFYLVQWGVDTLLYFKETKQSVKTCDFIFAVNPDMIKISYDNFFNEMKKWKKIEKNQFIEKINKKLIYTGSPYVNVIKNLNTEENIYKDQSLSRKFKYIYFQAISEGRRDNLKGRTLDRFNKFIQEEQIKIIKNLYNYCQDNAFKLIIKMRPKDKYNKKFEKYSDFFYCEEGKRKINLTHELIKISSFCIINKSNSIIQVSLLKKKFIMYDFYEKENIKIGDDLYTGYYNSEMFYNKFFPPIRTLNSKTKFDHIIKNQFKYKFNEFNDKYTYFDNNKNPSKLIVDHLI